MPATILMRQDLRARLSSPKFYWLKISALFVFCGITSLGLQAQTYQTIVNFNGTRADRPTYASLVQGVDGSLYGTTALGGTGDCQGGCGVVFKITRQGTFRIVHNFTGVDGVSPDDGLTLGNDGKLYGTTYQGTSSYGTVFSLTSDGTLTTLHGFDYVHGANPIAGVVQGPDGNFYGTTFAGGSSDSGTVFKLTPSGTFTSLYNFCTTAPCNDGFWPIAGLTLGIDGNFYGTTNDGGTFDYGTAFRITPEGVLTTLHSFGSGSDGVAPYGGLLLNTDGSFYGTTAQGAPITERSIKLLVKVHTHC